LAAVSAAQSAANVVQVGTKELTSKVLFTYPGVFMATTCPADFAPTPDE